MATVTDSDLKEVKDLLADLKLSQVRMEEKLASISESITDIKQQTNKQDNRLWVLISGMFLALLGIIAKFAFNPH